MNRYYNPVHTIEGRGCVKELPGLLAEAGLAEKKKLIIMWDASVEKHPGISALTADQAHCRRICFGASNPTVEQLYALYQETAADAPELVIAVGGGSTLDVGKSLCCLYGMEIGSADELREVIAEKRYQKPQARWIGIPTTAGTGSEVTCWATIWDPEKNAKRSVERQDNYALYALADPDMEAGIPVSLAVSSGLDACAHAVESCWARNTNAVSRALALSAIRMITEHMDALTRNEAQAHDAMACGSMIAGLAFSNTKTTACHSISYPLTMHYQIPHGAAVSMLLAPVFRLNAARAEALYDDSGAADCGAQNAAHMEAFPALLDALGVQDADELEKKVTGWLRAAGFAVRLRDWGAREEELPEIAAQGITKGRADNNPAELNPDIVLEILKSVY